MSVWSLCEHHMLPMNLQVAAGYVPAGEVVGLSKFARIAQRHAGRPDGGRPHKLAAGPRPVESEPVLSQQFLALATPHHHIRPE